MICLACAELRDENASETCPTCRVRLIPATGEHLEMLVQEKQLRIRPHIAGIERHEER